MKKLLLSFFLFFFVCNHAFSAIKWYDSLEEAQAVAQAQGKFIFIDFWAEWCGPCKRMDREVWNQLDIESTAARYVAVKINIDYDRATATNYGTKGIPFMLITDPWGEVLHQTVGYKGAITMKSILEMFPERIDDLHKALVKFHAQNKDANNTFEVANAYQALALSTTNDLSKRIFLGQSNRFFSKTKKLAKSNSSLLQKLAISKAMAWIVKKKPDKTIEEITQIGEGNILPENKITAYYALALAHLRNGDKQTAQLHLEKLKTIQADSPLISQIEQVFNE